MADQNERTTTAYHEAGHAVADALLSIAIEEVTIVAAEDYTGICRTHPLCVLRLVEAVESREEGADDLLRRHVVGRLAGGEAYRLLTGEDQDPDHVEQDMDGVADLVLRLLPCDAEHSIDATDLVNESSAIACSLLQRWWPAVEVVAHALLKQGTLAGREVMDLVYECRDLRQHVPPWWRPGDPVDG